MWVSEHVVLGVCVPDVHTEAVQAALAKHKERKMAVPMPSKHRSLVVQTSMEAYTPPGEEHVGRQGNVTAGTPPHLHFTVCVCVCVWA